MEFRFDLAWRERIPDPEALAETLAADAVVVANPANPVSSELLEKLFTP
jgi:hypothetical protein